MGSVSEPVPLRIARLRTQIAELSAAIRQLRQAGLDNAAAEVLLVRRRVELEGLLRPAPKSGGAQQPAGEATIGTGSAGDRRPG
jgi:hypothetical protein